MNANPIEQFRDAIQSSGLIPPDMIDADGKLHRFPSNGRAGDDAGWYVFHLDGFPVGLFGDWRIGLSEIWKADTGRKLTKQEKAEQRAGFDALRHEREAAETRGHEEAADKAAAIWQAAQPAPTNHGYLVRKGVKPHGTKVGSDGRLLVPMHDAAGKLWNIERIAAENPPAAARTRKGFFAGGAPAAFSASAVRRVRRLCALPKVLRPARAFTKQRVCLWPSPSAPEIWSR